MRTEELTPDAVPDAPIAGGGEPVFLTADRPVRNRCIQVPASGRWSTLLSIRSNDVLLIQLKRR